MGKREGLYLIDFGIVSSPCIAEDPITGVVLVVDLDLAVHRARCKAIAIVVECSCCNHIFMAMVQELEGI